MDKKISKKFFIFSFLFFASFALNIFFILKNYSSFFLKENKNLIESKVIKVIDGDTIDLENSERVRFYEINAPEYPKGCLGDEAKERVETLLLNKVVSIEKVGKDHFGRILGYVYFNKLLVNEILVEEGLAYFEDEKNITKNSLILKKAEDKAKLSNRGVWSNLCQTQKPGCLIKGNFRSANHTRIYHTPDCFNYDRIIIKPGTSDRWFCSEEEAIKAGFKKSADCPK
jgi:endonuclease YncB( thermonuclease family)